MGAGQQLLMAEKIAGSSLNAKIVTWQAALGGSAVSGGRATLLSNMMNSLDSASVTTKLAGLWIFADENTTAAALDIIALSTVTLVNTPTFTADQGYATNGTNSYVNLNSTSAGTQNSAAFGFYNRSNNGIDPAVEMGTSISGSTNGFDCSVSLNFDGNLYFALNDGNGDAGRAAPVSLPGIYVNSRTGSTLATIYKAGSSLATNGQTSTGVPSFNYCVGAAFNQSGVIGQFANRQFGMAFLANSGFSSTDASNFTTAIQTYMTAIGA